MLYSCIYYLRVLLVEPLLDLLSLFVLLLRSLLGVAFVSLASLLLAGVLLVLLLRTFCVFVLVEVRVGLLVVELLLTASELLLPLLFLTFGVLLLGLLVVVLRVLLLLLVLLRTLPLLSLFVLSTLRPLFVPLLLRVPVLLLRFCSLLRVVVVVRVERSLLFVLLLFPLFCS